MKEAKEEHDENVRNYRIVQLRRWQNFKERRDEVIEKFCNNKRKQRALEKMAVKAVLNQILQKLKQGFEYGQYKE